MNYIVVDFEFNQPFNFPNGKKYERDERCPLEIIQIGAYKLNSSLREVDCFDVYIKPGIYKRLHPFVKNLTAINNDILSEAPSFPEAYEEFVEFIGPEKCCLCTWGGDDINALYRNILFYDLKSTVMTKKFIDIQVHATKQLEAPNTAVALKSAVEAFNIEITEPFHDAFNDAYYTKEIMKRLDPETMVVKAVSVADIKERISTRLQGINLKPLFTFTERLLQRKLTEKEKKAVAQIYAAGQTGRFDIQPKKNKF